MGAQQEAEGQKDQEGQDISRCEKAKGRSQQARRANERSQQVLEGKGAQQALEGPSESKEEKELKS